MMLMKSVHKRMGSTSLPELLGLVLLILLGCVVITMSKIVNIFKAK